MTEAELLDALQEAFAKNDEAPEGVYTTGDICRILGRGTHFVRPLIGSLLASGDVELVRIRRQGIDGRSAQVPAYRFRTKAAA